MHSITNIFTKEKTNNVQTITSLEVAEMVEKRHTDLLRDIKRYCEQLNESNIALVEFFQESTYIDAKGEASPCYDVTIKGCEFIAYKLTGVKGTVFTARYINRFHDMEDYIKGNERPSLEAVNKAADILSGAYKAAGTDERYLALLVGSVYKECGLEFTLPPVKMDTDKLYDQTMIANELGVMSTSGKPHSQAIGVIIDALNISEDDKITTPYINHGHSGVVVQYKEKVLNMVGEWITGNNHPQIIKGENKSYNIIYKQRM